MITMPVLPVEKKEPTENTSRHGFDRQESPSFRAGRMSI